MAGRNYDLFAYCNNCSGKRNVKLPKDMLRCPTCNAKLRHKPRSSSAKRTNELYYTRL